ncbi:MAG: hypothetical protein JKY92_07740 [Magnetovibrio sp.]|nr:hypothetical protein [Magnetovibrio sp.]
MISSVSSATASSAVRSLSTDAIRSQSQQQSSVVSDGPDRENDGDADDGGSVTATRGQNVNIQA